MKKDRAAFHKNITPRAYALESLSSDCYDLNRAGDTRSIFCSFSCDPWQPVDVEYGITREALIILFTYGRSVILLTKGGKRSLRDFDLLAGNAGRVMYGATLVFKEDSESLKHEPGAAPTSERMYALEEAHKRGIRTWISLEPCFSYNDTLELIDRTYQFTDEYKIGKINYDKKAEEEVDWRSFAHGVSQKLMALKKDYYLKNDLRKYLEG